MTAPDTTHPDDAAAFLHATGYGFRHTSEPGRYGWRTVATVRRHDGYVWRWHTENWAYTHAAAYVEPSYDRCGIRARPMWTRAGLMRDTLPAMLTEMHRVGCDYGGALPWLGDLPALVRPYAPETLTRTTGRITALFAGHDPDDPRTRG